MERTTKMLRKNLQQKFITIDKRVALRDDLSLEAKGLYFIIQSYPDDYEIKLEELAKNSGCSINKVKKLLKEFKDKDIL